MGKYEKLRGTMKIITEAEYQKKIAEQDEKIVALKKLVRKTKKGLKVKPFNLDAFKNDFINHVQKCSKGTFCSIRG